MAPSLVKSAEANKLLVRPKPAFIVDSMLGSLARKLRFFGFDTWYVDNQPDIEIIQLGIEQRRIILTCDKDMYRRASKLQAEKILINGIGDLENIALVFLSCGTLLSTFMQAGHRCPACNGVTYEVARSDLNEVIPCSDVYSQFFQCSVCGKVYWEGSHYKNLIALCKRIDGRIIELLKERCSYITDIAPIPRTDFVSWSSTLA